MRRTARTLGATAAVAGGLALGFLAERRLLHPRLEVPALPTGDEPLGSLSGELTTVAGPDGTDIVVETYGPARPRLGDPQLLLSHGWICTGRMWHHQVAGLADRYRIITYDQPGHGRTSAPDSGEYDLDLLGDTLRAVVQAVAPDGPLVLGGHSLGGMAVLNAVEHHRDLLDDRVVGAVLMSTTSRARPERFTFEFGVHAVSQLEDAVKRLVPRLRGSRLSGATGRLYASTSDLSNLVVRAMAVGPDTDPRIVGFVEQLRVASDPDMVLGLAEAVLGVDVDAGLARLRAPVSLLVGTHDRLTPVSLAQRMAEVSGGELIELPGIGHMAPLEAPDEINRVLRQHLTGEVAAGAGGGSAGSRRQAG